MPSVNTKEVERSVATGVLVCSASGARQRQRCQSDSKAAKVGQAFYCLDPPRWALFLCKAGGLLYLGDGLLAEGLRTEPELPEDEGEGVNVRCERVNLRHHKHTRRLAIVHRHRASSTTTKTKRPNTTPGEEETRSRRSDKKKNTTQYGITVPSLNFFLN